VIMRSAAAGRTIHAGNVVIKGKAVASAALDPSGTET